MRLKRLIKEFSFEEKNRSRITLGDNVRLNPDTHKIQLIADETTGRYPTTSDLYFKTWIFSPTTVKAWLTIQEFAGHKAIDNVVVTSTGYRIGNGTDEYWWNGAAWEINTSSWNTISEVSENLPDFPVAGRSIQVVVNIKTTDDSVTPECEGLLLLWSSNIEFFEDIVYRSLIPELRAGVRPISEYLFTVVADTSTIDLLNDYPLETSYNVVDVDSVFNETDDAENLTDIFDSFNSGTQVITLTGAVTAGKVLRVRFISEPEVAVNTGQDYIELGKVPNIVLEKIDYVDRHFVSRDESIVKAHDSSAVKVFAPMQGTLDIQISFTTDKQIDMVRLSEEINRFFQQTKLLRSRGLDEEYDLWLSEPYSSQIAATRNDLQSGRCRFRIMNVIYYLSGDEDAYGVQTFKLRGDVNIDINS